MSRSIPDSETTHRNPFADIALVKVVRHPEPPPMANRETKIIGLALVSTPAAALVERVYYATGKRLKGKFDEDNPAHRRLLVMPSTVAKLEEARMLRVIDQVTKSHSPRVICFNELAFPASNGRARRGFLQELSRRAEEKDCLVLAGTSHDAITLFNSARVFLPGAGPAGVVYQKQLSARHTTECINVPSLRQVHVMEWYGLKLSMLTCIDVADFTAVAHVVKYGEGIDLLLTPACTDKEEKLYECARVVSEAMPGLVAFVNTGKAHKLNGVALFGFGQRIDASSKPPWIGDLVEENVDGCQVTHVELIHDTFRYRRTGLRSGKLRRGHPLFGLPTIASD